MQGVWERRDEITMRNELGRHHACSENIDTQIGRVLERLEDMGELENTLTAARNISAPMALPRRDFLRGGARASSLLILPRGLRGQGRTSPNGRLQLALVGVGGRGRVAQNALREEQFVAFCDVDHGRARAPEAAGAPRSLVSEFPDAKWFHEPVLR